MRAKNKLSLRNFIGEYKGKDKTILIIGDLHFPYHHRDALPFLNAVNKFYQPTRVISIGDMFDQHAFSRYDKDPDMPLAKDEIKAATKNVQELAKLFSKLEIVTGNHDKRLEAAAGRAGIPLCVIKDKQEIYNMPKAWKWYRYELIIDDIYLTHGKSRAYNKLSKNVSMNTIQGHHHSIIWCYLLEFAPHFKVGLSYRVFS